MSQTPLIQWAPIVTQIVGSCHWIKPKDGSTLAVTTTATPCSLIQLFGLPSQPHLCLQCWWPPFSLPAAHCIHQLIGTISWCYCRKLRDLWVGSLYVFHFAQYNWDLQSALVSIPIYRDLWHQVDHRWSTADMWHSDGCTNIIPTFVPLHNLFRSVCLHLVDVVSWWTKLNCSPIQLQLLGPELW